jgi:hypothetical protein
MLSKSVGKARGRGEKLFPRGSKFDALLRQAKAEVRAYDRSMTGEMMRLETQLYRALAAIYRLCRYLDANPEQRSRFIEQHGDHGNAGNDYQPVVRAIMGKCHDVTRSQVSKYASALALAAEKRVSPDRFVDFIKRSGGVKGAYEARVKGEKAPGRMLLDIKAQEAKLQSMLGPGVRFEPTRQTERHFAQAQPGLALAVIRIERDGSFTLHTILDRNPDTIARMLAKQAA